jgi:hypothetical protein
MCVPCRYSAFPTTLDPAVTNWGTEDTVHTLRFVVDTQYSDRMLWSALWDGRIIKE